MLCVISVEHTGHWQFHHYIHRTRHFQLSNFTPDWFRLRHVIFVWLVVWGESKGRCDVVATVCGTEVFGNPGKELSQYAEVRVKYAGLAYRSRDIQQFKSASPCMTLRHDARIRTSLARHRPIHHFSDADTANECSPAGAGSCYKTRGCRS